jgi:hypothetical protein
MTEHARSTFKIQGWDEKPYAEFDGGTKLTRASVTQAFTGDLAGTASIESLSFYREDQTADIVGLQRFEGTLGDKTGTFVMRSDATFDGTTAAGSVTIVDGSGTGDLAGLSGSGEWSAVSGPEGTLTLRYDIG